MPVVESPAYRLARRTALAQYSFRQEYGEAPDERVTRQCYRYSSRQMWHVLAYPGTGEQRSLAPNVMMSGECRGQQLLRALLRVFDIRTATR